MQSKRGERDDESRAKRGPSAARRRRAADAPVGMTDSVVAVLLVAEMGRSMLRPYRNAA